jgi:hypothetical protein
LTTSAIISTLFLLPERLNLHPLGNAERVDLPLVRKITNFAFKKISQVYVEASKLNDSVILDLKSGYSAITNVFRQNTGNSLKKAAGPNTEFYQQQRA